MNEMTQEAVHLAKLVIYAMVPSYQAVTVVSVIVLLVTYRALQCNEPYGQAHQSIDCLQVLPWNQ